MFTYLFVCLFFCSHDRLFACRLLSKKSARRTEFDFVLALCSAKQYDVQLGLVDYVIYAHRSLEVNSSSFIDPPFCEMLTQGCGLLRYVFEVDVCTFVRKEVQIPPQPPSRPWQQTLMCRPSIASTRIKHLCRPQHNEVWLVGIGFVRLYVR